jgi:hypothetical protein
MKTKYAFKNYNYSCNDILTSKDINLALGGFYKELWNIDPKLKFCVILKIKTLAGAWISISSLQILDKTEFERLKYIFNLFYNISSYKGKTIDKIVFRYRYLESDIAPKKCIFKKPSDFNELKEVLLEDYCNLPNNRLFETWGDAITVLGDNTYLVERDSQSFFIRQIENEYFVSFMEKGKEILYFQDIYDPNDETNNTFIRLIGNTELYYNNGIFYILGVYT